MKYVLIDSEDIGIIDFTKVKETSLDTLRYNNDKTLTFVKYEGIKPTFLGTRTVYTYTKFLELLSGETWQNEE
tara:strand:- start:528 stop:746 length:219 start_codon:yes stop_codon:yes gene_type:complete